MFMFRLQPASIRAVWDLFERHATGSQSCSVPAVRSWLSSTLLLHVQEPRRQGGCTGDG